MRQRGRLGESGLPRRIYLSRLRDTWIVADKLVVLLTALLVDNPTPSSTKVEVVLQNSTGRLTVEAVDESLGSDYRFSVSDAKDLGWEGTDGQTLERAGFILAASCSLSDPRVLFSLMKSQQHTVRLEPETDRPGHVDIVDTGGGKRVIIDEQLPPMVDNLAMCLGSKTTLDETQIFDIATRLLKVRLFDETGRGLEELNLLEAIKSYREALMATGPLSCYKALYNALEKAVNADKHREGDDFDIAASSVIKLDKKYICELRRFNNRVKHALRDKQDFRYLRTAEARLPQLSKSLKGGADAAILARIWAQTGKYS